MDLVYMTAKYGEEIANFAAARSARLDTFDSEIRPVVEDGLSNWNDGSEWYDDIVTSAGVLWSEIFEQESPTGRPNAALRTFLRELSDSLAKTSEPSKPPSSAQIDRVTRWIGVYTVNSATYAASRDAEDTFKTWVSMEDADVRELHRAVDGATVPMLGTFSVGGEQLHFPGEPIGSPEIWINCRCVIRASGGPDATARAKGIEMGTNATSFAATAEEAVAPEERDLTDDEIANEDLVDDVNEVPWHGVIVVENTPTGDGRQFDTGALSYASFPMGLTFQRMSADGHMQSVSVGRIDSIEKVGDEHRASGMFNLNVPEAHEAIDGIIFGSLGGVSVDVDSSEYYLEYAETLDDEEEDAFDLMFGGEVKLTHFTAGRIRSACLVQIPAFAEAYIALGADFEETVRDPEAGVDDAARGEDVVDTENEEEEEGLTAAAFAPGTQDGPGWITNPRSTQRLRNYWVHGEGAAKIRWGVPGDFNRCRRQLGKYVNPAFLAGTCANLHKEALKVWPGRERGDKHGLIPADADSAFSLVASAASAEKEDAKFFRNPEFTERTAHTVTEDGHVFGHLAAWGTCHVGIAEACVMPPSSVSNYSYFATGQTLTTEGMINTGRVVMWTGHAGGMASLQSAARHYDDTGYAVADIAIGEDAFGMWYSGKVRETAEPKDVKAFRGSALSGDWRRSPEGNLELIAALAVNAPGFPIPRPSFAFNGTEQLSLVASAGMLAPRKERKAVTASAFVDDADTLLAIGRVVADELEYRQERKSRLSSVRDEDLLAEAANRRAARIAAAKSLEEE
jgi:hypothetical protein